MRKTFFVHKISVNLLYIPIKIQNREFQQIIIMWIDYHNNLRYCYYLNEG